MGDMVKIVGYRFHPTPQELIGHYLRKKRLEPDWSVQKIKDFNIYDFEPSQLPGFFSDDQLDQQDWHFFNEPGYKFGNKSCVNRKTRGGNWKVTGKKRDVKDKRNNVIGWKITLVFYEGSGNSKHARTNWVMHEYHINHDSHFKREFVVVRIKKNPGTKHSISSTPNEDISSHMMASKSGNNDPECVLQVSQPLQNHDISPHRISQSLSNHDISPNIIFQPLSHHHISLNRESDLLSYHDISSNGESLTLSNQDTSSNREVQPNIEDFVTTNTSTEVEPLVPAVWDSFIDYNGLDHNSFYTQQTQIHLQQQVWDSPIDYNGLDQNSFSAQQTQIHLQQGSSHSCDFSSDSNVLNTPLGSEQENNWSNSQWDVQDEFSEKESGHSDTPDFHSTKPATGAAYVYGSSDESALLNGDSSVSNSPLGSEQENNRSNSQSGVRDEFYGKETVHSPPSGFNFSIPVTEAYASQQQLYLDAMLIDDALLYGFSPTDLRRIWLQ